MKRKYLDALFAAFILMLIWQVGSMLLNKSLLPSFISSVKEFFHLLLDGTLLKHILVSAYRVLAGIFFALLFAVPFGLGMGYSDRLERFFRPFLYLAYPLPKVVFLPVIIVLLGLGNAPKIFLLALVMFFQLVVVIRDSARSIPGDQIQAMRSLNAAFFQTFRHLIFPYCLSGIMTSLRATLGTAIAILFIAETFASLNGLGYFILNKMDSRDYPAMYAGILTLALFGGLIYLIFDLLEHYFCRWRYIETEKR